MKPSLSDVVLGIALLGLACGTDNVSAAGIDSVGRYGWQENVGWCDFYVDGTNGASVSRRWLSGYVWCENVGWLSLGNGPTNGTAYTQEAGDTGVNSDGAGHLSGYAWGENIGWVSFDTQAAGGSGVGYSSSGVLSGYAWGENVGWINMGESVTQAVAMTDTDADGLCDVCETDTGIFNGEYETGTSAALADTDGDGFGDGDELPAGTDPVSQASCLRVRSVAVSGTGATVEWQTVYLRKYYVQGRASMTTGSWSNLSPVAVWELDESPEGTERLLNVTPAPCGLYRVILAP